MTSSDAVEDIGVLLPVGGGCWTRSSPVRCEQMDACFYGGSVRLGEALDAADEFGA